MASDTAFAKGTGGAAGAGGDGGGRSKTAQGLRDKLLHYAQQAPRDGIASLVDETDMPELFDMAVRKIVADGDDKGSENMLVLRALLASARGDRPRSLSG